MTSRAISVPKMPDSSENHGHASAIGGGDDLGILHAASRAERWR